MISLVCTRVESGRQAAQRLRVRVQQMPAEAQPTELRRECERLRFLMPKANPLTIALTARILMARGLAP